VEAVGKKKRGWMRGGREKEVTCLLFGGGRCDKRALSTYRCKWRPIAVPKEKGKPRGERESFPAREICRKSCDRPAGHVRGGGGINALSHSTEKSGEEKRFPFDRRIPQRWGLDFRAVKSK